jgi:hypothetical protein
MHTRRQECTHTYTSMLAHTHTHTHMYTHSNSSIRGKPLVSRRPERSVRNKSGSCGHREMAAQVSRAIYDAAEGGDRVCVCVCWFISLRVCMCVCFSKYKCVLVCTYVPWKWLFASQSQHCQAIKNCCVVCQTNAQLRRATEWEICCCVCC